MIITTLLLLILAGVTAIHVREGLWRSMLAFFNVLVAASAATAWFPPLANLLEKHLASYTYLLDFLSAWTIFCVVMAVLRLLTDRLAPLRVAFPKRVEQVGVGLPAFLTGWVTMAFTAATLHLAPVPRDVIQPTPEARMFLGFAPDRKWLGWVRGCSLSGPFSRGKDGAVFDPRADFILRYADRRLKLEGEPGLRVAGQ